MEKSKSSITISQALKLYNGSSLPKMTILVGCIMAAIYIAAIIVFTVLIGLESGFAAVRKEVSEAHMGNMLLLFGSIGAAVISLLTYEKKLPGGKFFRSVKGGFETYKKMRTALLLSNIFGICLYAGIICAINAAVPIMEYGTATCVSFVIFLMLGIGFVNLINMLKTELARSLLNVIVFFLFGFAGVFTVWFNDGKLWIIHIIAAVIAAVFIPVTHKLMLNNYRKHRWDN